VEGSQEGKNTKKNEEVDHKRPVLCPEGKVGGKVKNRKKKEK
jgi:hypothetical protein